MTQLYIYEPQASAFRVHVLPGEARVPGMRQLPLTVADFLYLANTDIAWTHREALDALDALCERFCEPFSVDVAFRPVGLRARIADVQHFAGLAFELGRNLSSVRRGELYHTAVRSRLFIYVSPPYLSGRSVRVAAARALPTLSVGEMGVYVFALQSMLLHVGLFYGALTGRYCGETARSVRRMQHLSALPVTGEMRQRDWHALLQLTNVVTGAKIVAR